MIGLFHLEKCSPVLFGNQESLCVSLEPHNSKYQDRVKLEARVYWGYPQ